jgi:hypothetical protein
VKIRGERRTYEVEDWCAGEATGRKKNLRGWRLERERERVTKKFLLDYVLHSMSERQEFVPVVGDGDWSRDDPFDPLDLKGGQRAGARAESAHRGVGTSTCRLLLLKTRMWCYNPWKIKSVVGEGEVR